MFNQDTSLTKKNRSLTKKKYRFNQRYKFNQEEI
jgi:hypothetical protein